MSEDLKSSWYQIPGNREKFNTSRSISNSYLSRNYKKKKEAGLYNPLSYYTLKKIKMCKKVIHFLGIKMSNIS